MTSGSDRHPGDLTGERNWAGNYTYRATRLHRPTTLDELREIVATAPRVRVLGSRHSFTAIADSAELVSLDNLPADISVDRDRSVVSFNAGLTYGRLATALETEGLALHNLASLPHISVAGAVATGTHGSGDANGNLATAVAALEFITSEGALVKVRRGEPDFDGLVVSLGAIGAVTRITLDVQPAYEISQQVYEPLARPAFLENFATIYASGYSVSAFTRFGGDIEHIWVKSRTSDPRSHLTDLFGSLGARPATVERHPILGMSAVNCTRQLGQPGLWSDRLPHFRMGFTPSNGDELQSEYLVPRSQATSAVEAVWALGSLLRPLLQVCEIRTVAADRLWLSPQYERDSVALHFTWTPDQRAVEAGLSHLEDALAPFDARPHWGKVFLTDRTALARLYPRLPDFTELLARYDPRGAFRNDWLTTHVLP